MCKTYFVWICLSLTHSSTRIGLGRDCVRFVQFLGRLPSSVGCLYMCVGENLHLSAFSVREKSIISHWLRAGPLGLGSTINMNIKKREKCVCMFLCSSKMVPDMNLSKTHQYPLSFDHKHSL